MIDEQKQAHVSGASPENNGTFDVISENVTDASGTEFKASPEALAAAASALESITNRSFSGRNSELGKMINCRVCNRRHRKVDVVYREHFDENGKKTVTLLPLARDCKQVFKQMWVDEDLETGELSIQYATVPLPGQKGTPKAILGAAFFAKKRKKRRPSPVGLHLVEITRQLMPYVNKERFTTEEAQMLEARRMAVNTLRNRNEAEAKRIRKQQRESRRINRGR